MGLVLPFLRHSVQLCYLLSFVYFRLTFTFGKCRKVRDGRPVGTLEQVSLKRVKEWMYWRGVRAVLTTTHLR